MVKDNRAAKGIGTRVADLEAMGRVGQRVRMARKAKGLTMEETAELAETSSQFLAQIERGKQCPNAIKLGRVAKALGVSTDYLIFGGSEPHADHQTALTAEYLNKLDARTRTLLIECIIHIRKILELNP